MMKNFTIKIPKEQVLKMERASRRNTEIELGMRVSTNRVHKSVKSYTRKTKHKVKYV